MMDFAKVLPDQLTDKADRQEKTRDMGEFDGGLVGHDHGLDRCFPSRLHVDSILIRAAVPCVRLLSRRSNIEGKAKPPEKAKS